jgi:hypothetical protein
MIATKSLKGFVTTYPILFGALIGLLIFCSVVVIVIWFPSIEAAMEGRSTLVRDVWFTQALFVVSLVRFWPLRRRTAFWISMVSFFLAHSLCIFLYSFYAGPISTSQWTILIAIEAVIAFFLVPWVTRLVARHIS